jgi:cytidylate kinase
VENLHTHLKQDIKVLARPLQDDTTILVEVLKRRLTKKEWKYYKLKINDTSIGDICIELKCDNKRLEEISKQTITKLNQEKIKHELEQ